MRQNNNPKKPLWPFVMNAYSDQSQGLIGWWPIYTGGGAMLDMLRKNNFGPNSSIAPKATGPDGGNNSLGLGNEASGASNWYKVVSTTFADNLGAFSASCWYNRLPGTALGGYLIGKIANAGYASGAGWLLQEANGLEALVQVNGGTSFRDLAETTGTTGIWQHACMTWDGTTLLLYRNGLSVGTPSSGGSITTITNTNPLSVGGDIAGDSTAVNKTNLEELRIYNRCLRPNEVWAMYNPQTRWQLRYQPGERKWFKIIQPSNGGPGIQRPKKIVKPSFPFSINASNPINNGLIGWWPGISGSGQVIDITKHKGKDSAFQGTAPSGGFWAPGVDGGKAAIRLDGSTSYTQTPTFAGPQTAMSISLWVKQTSAALATIAAQDNDTSQGYFNLQIESNGAITGYIIQAIDTITIGRTTATGIVTSKVWHHITMTWNGGTTNAAVALYMDGKKVDTTDSGLGVFTTPYAGAFYLTIGARYASGVANQLLLGSVEDVRYWGRCITPSEVWSLYNPQTRWNARYRVSRKAYSFPGSTVQNLMLTATDAPTMSESLARTFAGLRAITDAPTTSESLTRTFVGLRTVTDAPTTSESLTRTFVGLRTVTDAPTTSESLTRTFVGLRTVTDAPTTSESLTRTFVGLRTATDAPTTSESLTRTFVGLRTATDATTTSESLTRTFVGLRTATDAPTTSESLTRTFVGLRTATDAPTTSESLTRTFVGLRTATDAPTTSESLTRTFVGLRTATDAPTTSESLTRTFVGLRTATDAPTTSESVIKSGSGITRIATDAPTTSESLTRTFVGLRTATDAPTTSESLTRTFVGLRTTTDAPTTSESLVRTFVGLRTATDAPTTSESLTRTFVGLRTATDAPTTSESVIKSGSVVTRTVTDNPTTSESLTRLFIGLRVITDNPGISEILTRIFVGYRTTTDSPHTSEFATGTTFTIQSYSTSNSLTLSQVILRQTVSTFVIQATDSAGEIATKSFQITVN